AAHRDPVRARVAQFLQALRRALRGLRRQAGVPRVRRRGARASRSAHPRVPCASRAAGRTGPRPARRRAGERQRFPRAPGRAPPMIDLHTHTTASDGRCTPAELVERAGAAGVTVLSVTDHDTVAGCRAAETACAAAGIEFVPGIEVTAVREEIDVHFLGYFVDPSSDSLLRFLAEQRQRRFDRIAKMIGRLAELGIPLDADAILRPALENPGTSIGRPWIARALVAGRY